MLECIRDQNPWLKIFTFYSGLLLDLLQADGDRGPGVDVVNLLAAARNNTLGAPLPRHPHLYHTSGLKCRKRLSKLAPRSGNWRPCTTRADSYHTRSPGVRITWTRDHSLTRDHGVTRDALPRGPRPGGRVRRAASPPPRPGRC